MAPPSTGLLVLVSCVFGAVLTFNLESRIPIIKSGVDGTYFGFSVASHLIKDGEQSTNFSRILVGAPKYGIGGAVYSCPLTALKKDCEVLNIEEPAESDEIRDDQWLGVTVRSQKPGGYVLVCAHRYVRAPQSNARWGWGICYTLSRFLDMDYSWIPCDGRSTAKAHEEFGYCQAGTSGILTAEDNSILLGLPGPFTWKGTVFATTAFIEAGAGLNHDKQLYMGPLDETSPVEKYSYLGMSVTSGIFFGNNVSYVAGAPRSNGTGQVVFFTKLPGNPTLHPHLTLSGDTFASSYGYELAAVDLNNDTYLDLVVGAPFYYGKDAGGAIYIYMNSAEGIKKDTVPLKIVGTAESRFGLALANLRDINKDAYDDLAVGAPYDKDGAVYIYLGSKNGISRVPSQIIRPQDNMQGPSFKTFGYSLSGGVDLDRNGYPDLVVGAYDSDKVAYLRSRPVVDIETSVVGKLTNISSTIPQCNEDRTTNKTCFGFRVCFRLKSAVQIKTTVLKIIYNITADVTKTKSRVLMRTPKNEMRSEVTRPIRLTSSEHTKTTCFNEIAYLQETLDILTPIKFELSYTFNHTVPEQLETRALIDINEFPILNKKNAFTVFEAQFAKECGDDDICRSDLDVRARLDLTNGQLVLEEGKELRLNLTITNKGDPAYEAAAYISHPSSLSFIASTEALKYSCQPPVENASLVVCQLGNPLKRTEPDKPAEITLRFNPTEITDIEKELQIEIKVNSTSYELSPQPNTVISAAIVRRAEIEIRGVATPEQVYYSGNIRGESAMSYEEDIGEYVEHVYEVVNHGPWKVGVISVNIDWPYEVQNNQENGKWLLYMVEDPLLSGVASGVCHIKPEYVNKLKLKKRPVPGKETVSQNDTIQSTRNDLVKDKSILTPKEQDVSDKESHVRSKREVVVFPEEMEIDGKKKKVVIMDCRKNTAKCFSFTCNIFNLGVKQQLLIKIRSRLWSSTFVEDYADVDMVLIRSRGEIVIDPKYDTVQNSTANDFLEVETKAYPDITSQLSQDVPLWVIIVSAVAGLILLVVLIAILWKLGFFRRKKREEMMTGKVEKSKDVNNSAY